MSRRNPGFNWRDVYTIGARSILSTREVRVECSFCVWYFDQKRWADNVKSVGVVL